ncbi:DET1 homolog isoform X4 [Halichoerus grypus]
MLIQEKMQPQSCQCVPIPIPFLTSHSFSRNPQTFELFPSRDVIMDHHVSTIKPRRIQNQNVIHRLEQRRISSGKAGTHWHQVRVFHQNVFPNFTVVNVEKPPCFLRKFSPDGRYFIAFSSDQTSLEIYEYQGCQAAEDLLQGYEGEILSNGNDQRSVNIRGRLFERFFVLLHITNVAANGEHLNRECSLFTDDCRCVIVGSAAYLPDEPHPPFYEVYRNSESVTPNPRSPLEDYSLHIIDLHTGRLCDTRTFKCDKVVLSHNQGLYLYKNILAILSVQQQTIHVFQVTPEGTFIDVRTIGRFCYEDDLLTVSAVCPEVQRDSQTGMANPFRDPFINSLKHRLLVYLWRRAEQDGSAMAKRRFFQYFDQLRQLRMWKMQLLDENHLFIKYTSEDVVTLRVTDPSQNVSLDNKFGDSEERANQSATKRAEPRISHWLAVGPVIGDCRTLFRKTLPAIHGKMLSRIFLLNHSLYILKKGGWWGVIWLEISFPGFFSSLLMMKLPIEPSQMSVWSILCVMGDW